MIDTVAVPRSLRNEKLLSSAAVWGVKTAMARPRILIIEDERGLTDVLTYNLQREGYDTVVAHDGQEGLRKAQMHLPDVSLLDLMLPGLNGLDVCRELRAGKRTRR